MFVSRLQRSMLLNLGTGRETRILADEVLRRADWLLSHWIRPASAGPKAPSASSQLWTVLGAFPSAPKGPFPERKVTWQPSERAIRTS
jgi:hypothetical protein